MADEANDGKRPERCELCRFWQKDDGGSVCGDCHRFPPTVLVADTSGTGVDTFPTTRDTDWCGEFRPAESVIARELLDMSVQKLKLSTRAMGSLRKSSAWGEPIFTVGELLGKTAEDLLDRKNFGMSSLDEVREALGRLGLKLAGD